MIRKPQLSVQLHSVKNEISTDFVGTLQTISAWNIDGVEFAGRFGPYENKPAALKVFLDKLGIKVSAAHVSINEFEQGKLLDTIKFYQALGTNTLIIPHDPRADDPKQVVDLAKELTAISTLLSQHGMKLGYHNHAQEFNDFEQTTFWDYLASNTPSSMILQLDVGWAKFANVEPIEYVKRYPNRSLTTHYKIRTHAEQSKAVILGKDKYSWESLIQANITYGGTQWIVIEQEEYPTNMSAIDSLEASTKYIQSLLNKL